MHLLLRDCEIQVGSVFIQTNAILKQKKIAIQLSFTRADAKEPDKIMPYSEAALQPV